MGANKTIPRVEFLQILIEHPVWSLNYPSWPLIAVQRQQTLSLIIPDTPANQRRPLRRRLAYPDHHQGLVTAELFDVGPAVRRIYRRGVRERLIRYFCIKDFCKAQDHESSDPTFLVGYLLSLDAVRLHAGKSNLRRAGEQQPLGS